MTELDAWYRYAAGAAGFIGGALRAQRERVFMTQEQQRALLGILDGKYDQLWLRLQAMPLPRTDQVATDLQRIVAKVVSEVGREATVDRERLAELIRMGMETS
ncbi:MAG TPA: hypothetical protein VEL31_31315 [Ktedonobacteraceae bacterium]|nr:hypothetical protein [Ktedonobacteraceae bacterium]